MKALVYIFAYITVAVSVFATSAVQKEQSFEDIVKSADHVVVGKVIEVSMRDKKGKIMRDPKARTEPHSGNVISFRVVVEEGDVLKTSAKGFPRMVSYDLWPSLIMDLASMQELEGQSVIVLLEGADFRPHGSAPLDFMWPSDMRERVMRVIEAAKKNPTSQHSQLRGADAPLRG